MLQGKLFATFALLLFSSCSGSESGIASRSSVDTRTRSIVTRGGGDPDINTNDENAKEDTESNADEKDDRLGDSSMKVETFADADKSTVDGVTTSKSGSEATEGKITSDLTPATNLRFRGKAAHDEGNFVVAADLFREAADSLQKRMQNTESTVEKNLLIEECATCRLHQALCHLKSEEFEACLEACDAFLEAPFIQVQTPAARARAHHRRAKAKLALGDYSGALQDARSAAFLGDRKAVKLYGKLMRESSKSSQETPVPAASSLLDGAFASNSPFNSPSAALLESLLTKSQPHGSDDGKSAASAFNPASLLFGGNSMGNQNLLSSLSGAGANGMAGSLLKSVSRRLDDESTQETISNFLQGTSKAQLQQFASMAGMTIPDSQLDRIEGICHGITPRTIKRTVSTTKGAIYGIRLLRRISKILQKYKGLLVILALSQWTKSAILRPMPIDRAAAKKAAKLALKDAMKANRL